MQTYQEQVRNLPNYYHVGVGPRQYSQRWDLHGFAMTCHDLYNLFALDLLFCAILPYVWCINPAFFAEYLAPILYILYIKLTYITYITVHNGSCNAYQFPSNQCIDACASPIQGKLIQIEDQGAGFNPRAKPSHHYPINDCRKGNKSTATSKHDILSHMIPHLYHHCFSHALSRSSDMFSFSDMLTIKKLP